MTLVLTLEPSAVGRQSVCLDVEDVNSVPNATYGGPLAFWTVTNLLTTNPPAVAMASMPVVGTSQVLHYEISDGNGYTFVSSAGGELSQGALATSPCYFEYFPPNIIELYQLTSSGDTFLGEGYIGGSWSYPSTNGIIGGSGGLPGPGTCSIDLNQSRVYTTSAGGTYTMQNPNSGTIPNLYLDLWTGLDSKAQSTLPLNIYMSAMDAVIEQVLNAYIGTWCVAGAPSCPVIVTSPSSLTFFATVGGPSPASQTVAISNGGGATFNWTASVNFPVSMSLTGPTSGTNSGTITAAVNTSLVTGVETAYGNIEITAPGATNTPLSVPVILYVTQGCQTITFGALANQVYGTAPFTVSATASSGLPVSFSSQTTSVCTVNGSTVTLAMGGTCTIQATQGGNQNYSAASASQSFTVTPKSQTINFGALSSQVYGTTLTVSATATSTLTVSFSSLTTSICTVSGSTVTLVSGGTCTIQATQGGNASYGVAPPVNQSFTVTPESQTINFGTLSSQLYGAAPFTVGATATSTLTVSFTSLTTSVCTVSGNTVTLVAVGTCTVQATQGGNADYAAAPVVNQSFTVTIGTGLLMPGSPAPSLANGSPTVVPWLPSAPRLALSTDPAFAPTQSLAISRATPCGVADCSTTTIPAPVINGNIAIFTVSSVIIPYNVKIQVSDFDYVLFNTLAVSLSGTIISSGPR